MVGTRVHVWSFELTPEVSEMCLRVEAEAPLPVGRSRNVILVSECAAKPFAPSDKRPEPQQPTAFRGESHRNDLAEERMRKGKPAPRVASRDVFQEVWVKGHAQQEVLHRIGVSVVDEDQRLVGI